MGVLHVRHGCRTAPAAGHLTQQPCSADDHPVSAPWPRLLGAACQKLEGQPMNVSWDSKLKMSVWRVREARRPRKAPPVLHVLDISRTNLALLRFLVSEMVCDSSSTILCSERFLQFREQSAKLRRQCVVRGRHHPGCSIEALRLAVAHAAHHDPRTPGPGTRGRRARRRTCPIPSSTDARVTWDGQSSSCGGYDVDATRAMAGGVFRPHLVSNDAAACAVAL